MAERLVPGGRGGFVTESATAERLTPAGFLNETSAVSGSASVTLGTLTLAATGTLRIAGSASVTLDGATLSATGVLPIFGSLGATLDAVTLAASGALPITGSLGVTLDAAALAGNGFITTANNGTLSVTLGSMTLSATGIHQLFAFPILAGATTGAILASTGLTAPPVSAARVI